MIARIWRGWTAREDADAYVEYLERTGMVEYRATPGNLELLSERAAQPEPFQS
jgi:hypothetical protein